MTMAAATRAQIVHGRPRWIIEMARKTASSPAASTQMNTPDR
jgi:hypothetical protein